MRVDEHGVVSFEVDLAVCATCGHRHSVELGGICVGCPCGDRPEMPRPTVRLFCWSCSGAIDLPPGAGCRTTDAHDGHIIDLSRRG